MSRLVATGLLALGLLALGLLFVSPYHAHAQEAPPEPAAPLSQEEQLIQALFECEDEAALTAAIAAAEEAEVPQQAILEARFLFRVDQQDFAAVGALAPLLTKQKEAFDIHDSVIFSVPEEFYAIIEYCYALAALEKGDLTSFKQHITEAFWLSPRQAAAFGPHIDRLRRDRAMAELQIDMEQTFASQEDNTQVSLKSLAKETDHLVIHFWSPWSNESEAHLPDFLAIVEELSEHKIPIVSLLIEPSAEALAEAKKFQAELNATNTGNWIVDNSTESLTRKLRVLELPTFSVLKVDGTVLFSGHPSEDGLWNALQEINKGVQRPRLEQPE